MASCLAENADEQIEVKGLLLNPRLPTIPELPRRVHFNLAAKFCVSPRPHKYILSNSCQARDLDWTAIRPSLSGSASNYPARKNVVHRIFHSNFLTLTFLHFYYYYFFESITSFTFLKDCLHKAQVQLNIYNV